MAIKLEYYNIIVPITTIHEKCGGSVYERRYETINDFQWNDGHLFREGCMNDFDLHDMLDEWEEKGFKLITVIDGQKHWKELCVVSSGIGPSYPCNWISFDMALNIVWMKGKKPGDPVGPAGRELLTP